MKGQIKTLSNEELGIFKAYLNETYEYFRFNRIGHDKIDKEIYHNKEKEEINFKYIWDIMLRISEFGYLSHLANIFDKDSHFDPNIGKYVDNIVFCRIADEAKLVGCESTIEKIRKARNKTLDHIDSDMHTYNVGKTLSEVFKLDPAGKDIQLLFDKTFELLRMEKHQEEIEKTMEEKFKGWYGIFKKGYPKSLKDIIFSFKERIKKIINKNWHLNRPIR